MMGTGPFAAPTLRRLYQSDHKVLALVTRPPRPVHGKTRTQVNPMRDLALEHGTTVLDPESINTDDTRAQLAEFSPDLFVVCDYGQILKPETLAVARHGGINLHGSLLPKYRGAAPINWAIYYGEAETGVTVIHMTPQVDAGPAIAQARTPIGADETAVDVEPRLAELGAPLVLESIEAIVAGRVTAIPQDPSQASRAPRLKKNDGAVDWTHTAHEIRNQVRAMEPWPKTFTYLQRTTGEPLRLILNKVSVVELPADGTPGEVVEAAAARLVVATGGGGALSIENLQPAGKRVLAVDEFLRGYPVRAGDHFGSTG